MMFAPVLPARRSVVDGGTVERRTIVAPGERSGVMRPIASSTAERSADPSSRAGVPTATMMYLAPRTASAKSSVKRIFPVRRCLQSSSSIPASRYGVTPACNDRTRSGTMSQPRTTWPSSAKPTALAIPTYPVPTMQISVLLVGCKRSSSVGALCRDDRAECIEYDASVHARRSRSNVNQIDLRRIRCMKRNSRPARDLPEPGDPGLDEMTEMLPRLVSAHDERHLRPRPDDGHIAPKDVEKLR